MAPQSETFYGSLKMDKVDRPQSKGWGRVVAAVAVLAVVGVAAVVLRQTATQAPARAINSEMPEWASGDEDDNEGVGHTIVHPMAARAREERFPGNELIRIADDCECTRSVCPSTAEADGKHYCAVKSSDCMGADFKMATKIDGTECQELADLPGSDADANCKAVCDYVEGDYDCWNWPCLNGGYCKDGHDKYKCYCATGYDGDNCGSNIDECAELNGDEEHVVCDPHADCKDTTGAYECSCKNGWQGQGYRDADVVDVPSWMSDFDDSTGTYECEDVDDCAQAPCMNGAKCENSQGIVDGWSCVCPLGPTGGSNAWIGRSCDADVDECEENLHDCDANAECVNTDGSFLCLCRDNWQSADPCGDDHAGRSIEIDDDDMVDSTCRDSADNKHKVGCYDIDDCASDPCKNGGTCDGLGRPGCTDPVTGQPVACYVCACAYGWSGLQCERDENECVDSELGARVATQPATCRDSVYATCTNTDGAYECRCNLGWTGDGVTCIDADDCEFSPCSHGGTCEDCGTLCFACDCVNGWRGVTCQTDVNECTAGVHGCNDEATCTNTPGSYDCNCDPGWTGNGVGASWLETTDYMVGSIQMQDKEQHGCVDIDDCKEDLYTFDNPATWKDGPCKHGSCTDLGVNAYTCTCMNGYVDSNCDRNINECDSLTGTNACHREATCTDEAPTAPNYANTYSCECNEGFTGDGYSCKDIGDCGPNTCNNGFCSDTGANMFRCTCADGWEDTLCDKDKDECSDFSHECGRNAECTNTDGSYTCTCGDGFTGDGLEPCTDVDDCASQPCHNGVCTDEGVNLYSCACADGWMDFDCDFDINECVIGSHNCHEQAKCVNIDGSFLCKCFNGMEGDGVKKCKDLDDCDPDPCDLDHGTCRDLGPNAMTCECEPGWGCNDIGCTNNCNECEDGTHSCSLNADCTDNEGSFTCECHYPIDEFGGGFYGDGFTCMPCTICDQGFRPVGICKETDRTCVNIDECAEQTDTCDDNAKCEDTDGAFSCECNQQQDDEWWGDGHTCTRCTHCYEGFHEVSPCTSTTDRVCQRDIAAFVPQQALGVPFDNNNDAGRFFIETEADDNRQCLQIAGGDWYPSRIEYGNDGTCGIPRGRKASQYANLMWAFVGLGDNTAVAESSGVSNVYLIRYGGRTGKCLFFGDHGKDLYPSLQHCKDYEDESECPWINGNYNMPMCGFDVDGISQRDGLLENMQAIWKVTTLQLNERKFLLQSAASGAKNPNGVPSYDCLVFEKQGAATHPTRYNWGNGDDYCGAGDWEGKGKDIALLANKQAVFILTSV